MKLLKNLVLRENKRQTGCILIKVFDLPDHIIISYLPSIHSVISISLEKSMKNPKTKQTTDISIIVIGQPDAADIVYWYNFNFT